MEKRTRLITIEYDEYVELTEIKNNFDQSVLKKLKGELNKLDAHFLSYGEIQSSELKRTLNSIINVIDKNIMDLENKK